MPSPVMIMIEIPLDKPECLGGKHEKTCSKKIKETYCFKLSNSSYPDTVLSSIPDPRKTFGECSSPNHQPRIIWLACSKSTKKSMNR